MEWPVTSMFGAAIRFRPLFRQVSMLDGLTIDMDDNWDPGPAYNPCADVEESSDLFIGSSGLSSTFCYDDVWSDSTALESVPSRCPKDRGRDHMQGFSTGFSFEDIFDSDGEKIDDVAGAILPCNKIGHISSDEIYGMHPNKIWMLVLEYILPRYSVLPARRKLTSKVKAPESVEMVLGWLKRNPMSTIVLEPLNAVSRSTSQKVFFKWVARLAGLPHRQCRNDLGRQHAESGLWRRLDDNVKCRFFVLRRLEQTVMFKDLFPELKAHPGEQTHGIDQTVSKGVTSEADESRITSCFGLLATYNTKIGILDPDILTWVQEGHTGPDLETRLQKHPLLEACFKRFKDHIQSVAAQLHFRSWAVCMEHGSNAKDTARIHFHAAMGVDISRGVGFLGVPKMQLVDKDLLEWKGCASPFVKFSTFKRPCPNNIFQGIATIMYYVAGPKIGQLFMEASLLPFKDPHFNLCIDVFSRLSHVIQATSFDGRVFGNT